MTSIPFHPYPKTAVESDDDDLLLVLAFTPLSSPPPWHVQRQLLTLARTRGSGGALVQQRARREEVDFRFPTVAASRAPSIPHNSPVAPAPTPSTRAVQGGRKEGARELKAISHHRQGEGQEETFEGGQGPEQQPLQEHQHRRALALPYSGQVHASCAACMAWLDPGPVLLLAAVCVAVGISAQCACHAPRVCTCTGKR